MRPRTTAPKPEGKRPPETVPRGNGPVDEMAVAWALEQIARVVGH